MVYDVPSVMHLPFVRRETCEYATIALAYAMLVGILS